MSAGFRADAIGAANASSVASSTIVVPTTGTGGTVVAGDVARLVVASTSATAALSAVTSPGGTWTVRSGRDVLPGSAAAYLLTKTLAAGDIGATLTLTFTATGRITSQMNVYFDVTETGIAVATPVIEASADTTALVPSLAAVTAGALIDVAFVTRVSSGIAPDVTVAAPYVQGTSSRHATTSGTSNLASEGAHRVAGAAGSYGGESLTTSGGLSINYALALPPVGRDITLTIGPGRSRTLTAAGSSRGLAAAGTSRTLTAEPLE